MSAFTPRALAAAALAALLTLLAACQSNPPVHSPRDPDLPPPAPITPPPAQLPPQGQAATAPLPGTVVPAPAAPENLSMKQAQQRLNTLGYDAGAADGVAGRRTQAALRAFQHDRGLPASGRLDAATVRALAAGH